jgi:hypothetical protein
MTYPPYPGEPNPAQPTSGQPSGWGPPQPPAYPDPTLPEFGAQPQYGQPQPQYGQPQYGQPQYGQPQPQYGQPQYGPPGFPPPLPPQKSKTPIVLGIVALVLVLCVGGVTSLYLIGKNASDADDASGITATGRPTTESTPTSETTKQADPPKSTVKIAEPVRLGGHPKLTDPEFAELTEELQKEFASDYSTGNSFSAFYGDIDAEQLLAVFAWEADVPNAKTALAGNFVGMGVGGIKISNLADVSTGQLGGYAKCGDGKAEGSDVAVCGWADEGSMGMIMYFQKKAKQVRGEFPRMRAQIETKS